MKMEALKRLFTLDNILRYSRQPVSKKILLEKLNCSDSTFKHLKNDLEQLLIPIEYCKKQNGYYYNKSTSVHVPGLWFNHDALQALLIIHQLLQKLQPSLLNECFQPLVLHVNQLLSALGKTPEITTKRLQVTPIAHQNIPSVIFNTLSQATIKNKAVAIQYRDIQGTYTERTISPQRLIYYRDNWYLDAWCHLRGELRMFWVAGMETVNASDEDFISMEERKLEQYFETSYGIFTGDPKYTAHLRFIGQAAMRAKGAQWHADQRQQLNTDGSLDLWVPYSDYRELVMDILKYGAEVKVLAPDALQAEVLNRLKKTINLYENFSEAHSVS